MVQRTDGRRFERWPEPPPMLVDLSASMWIEKAAMLTSIQSAGIAPKSEDHTGKKAHKKISTLALKPKTGVYIALKSEDHTGKKAHKKIPTLALKPKTGVSVVLQNFVKKKRKPLGY